MTKQSITITVEVPDGYELTGEWRSAKAGEFYLTHGGECAEAAHTFNTSRLILRKTWKPPAWLPEGAWLFKWGGGETNWAVSSREPVESFVHKGQWSVEMTSHDGWRVIQIADLAALHSATFSPPPVNKIQVRHTEATR